MDLLPFPIPIFFRLAFDGLDDDCRIAADDGVRRHVFHDDRAGCDDGIVADRDARIDDSAPADPHIIADAHRFAEFDTAQPLFDIERMGRRIDVDARPDQAVIADADVADVEEDTVEIGKEVMPDMDIIAVITAEVRLDI